MPLFTEVRIFYICVALAFVAVFGALSLPRRRLHIKNDAREPFNIPQKFPYFGHVIGMLQYGLRYFDIISARHPYPIFTLQLLNQKIYVVTSPNLVREIQRNTKTLSFNPAILPAMKRMLGFDDEGMEIISYKSETEDSFFGEMHRIQKVSLGPGTSSLEQLNRGVRSYLMASTNELYVQQPVHLYGWVRQIFTKSNTRACFGKSNPFDRYNELENTFWDWEENVKVLLLGLPKLLVPKSYSTAHKTRQTLVDAFLEYLDECGSEDAASFIKDLCDLGKRRGLSNENSARALIGSVLAIISSPIPTTFWLLAYIFSQPSLLTAVREEVACTMCSNDGNDKNNVKRVSIDTSQSRDRCPLFVSAYEEVLRLTAGIATIRYTVEDTLINNEYLLAKDCSIQMPTAFIHVDPASWGPDAQDFKADRFLKSKLTREEQANRTAAFRPFGGGNTLCPGRHFAFEEVITFVGTVVMGFDISPVGGKWRLPEKDKSRMPLSSLKPLTDIEVTLSRRRGFESVLFE